MPYLQRDGEQLPLPVGETLIGAGAPGALPGAGEGGQPVAAVVVAPDGSAVARAAGGGEVRVNGVRLGEPRPLLHGDKLEVGAQALTFGDDRQAGSTMHLPVAGSPAMLPRERGATLPGATGGRLVSLTDGREYAVPVQGLVIGRDPSCDVVVPSTDVSRRHATIAPVSGGYVLTDLSANGVRVNGARVEGSCPLGRGDVLQVGEEELRFHAESAPPPRPSLATLEVANTGPARGARVEIVTAVVRVGRGSDNDLVIPDESVSHAHALLARRGAGWTVTDLRSTNGTYVRGRRVQGSEPVPDGADLRFGSAKYIFHPVGAAPAAPAATRSLAAGRAGTPAPAAIPAGGRGGAASAFSARVVRAPVMLRIAVLALLGAVIFFLFMGR